MENRRSSKAKTSPASDADERLEVLRQLLREGALGTQEELCEELDRRKFSVTQATVSRDLRRLGAIKVSGPEGTTVYRLPDQPTPLPMEVSSGLGGLLLDQQTNGSMIVLRTRPGSASLVAHHLDTMNLPGILGTIAGDDTIFIAPAAPKNIPALMTAIHESLNG